MNISFILTVIYLLSCCLVSAERMFRFTFNNGEAPTTTNGCTANDNRWIDPIFNVTSYLRTRQLTSASPIGHDHHHRQLNAFCRDNCAGKVPGTCRATGCAGYGGRELVGDQENIEQNHRETMISCETQVLGVHTALDLLMLTNKISSSCKTFLLKSKRSAECYDDIIYGEIISFTFYNANIDRLKKPGSHSWGIIAENVTDGFQVCSGTKIPLNMEVMLNPCVNYVNFTLMGPNLAYSRNDNGHPMLLFNTSEYFSTFGGRYLAPGWYTMTARPDGFIDKQKQMRFRVNAC
jgi:hypothetical protein